MSSDKNPDIAQKIEENAEVKDDRDANPDQAVAIELPIEPDDANAQPT